MVLATPPKPFRRTSPVSTDLFRPAHWVSAKTRMRDEDIVGAQRALADIGRYRPWPDLGFAPVAERRLFEGLKAFQRSQGLTPDGEMGPAGPTAQALDAARHHKANAGARRPAREMLGRGANLPLDLSVGEGGANREADVKAVKAGLGLLGYYPAEKARRPDGRVGRDDGHDLEFGIGVFQNRFGLKPDRRMDPFGPTQARLDELLQPAVDRAWGFDIENPRAPDTAGDPLLVSADPDADPGAQAAMLDQLRAHGLEHMAEARRTDALYGWDGADAAAGGEDDDTLEDNEIVDDGTGGETREAPQAAERGDAPDQAASEVDEPDQAAYEPEGVDPELDRARRMLVSSPFVRAAENPERLARVAEQERQIVDSFTTEQVEDRLRRLTLHTRRNTKDPYGPKLDSMQASDGFDYQRRILAEADILRQRYLEAESGLSVTEANQRVLTRIGEGMGLRPRDLRLLVEFVPIAGDAFAVYDGVLALWHAANSDTPDERLHHLQEASLAMVGLVPIIGDPIKLSLKARRNLRKLGIPDEEHEEFIHEQVALRVFATVTSGKMGRLRSFSIKELKEMNPTLANLPDSEIRRLQNITNPTMGATAELLVDSVIAHGKLIKRDKNSEHLSFTNEFDQLRRYDSLADFDISSSEFGDFFEKSIRDTALLVESKFGGGRLSSRQRTFDLAANADPDAISSTASSNSNENAPIFGEVLMANIPITLLPLDEATNRLRSALLKSDYSQETVNSICNGLEAIYEMEEKSGLTPTLKSLTQATIAAAESLRID